MQLWRASDLTIKLALESTGRCVLTEVSTDYKAAERLHAFKHVDGWNVDVDLDRDIVTITTSQKEKET